MCVVFGALASGLPFLPLTSLFSCQSKSIRTQQNKQPRYCPQFHSMRAAANKSKRRQSIKQKVKKKLHINIITHLIPQPQLRSLIMNRILKGFLVDSQTIIVTMSSYKLLFLISALLVRFTEAF